MITPFTHARATTIDDALRAMADGAVPYAGGTELLAAMKLGLLAPERLVDLKHIRELTGVSLDARTGGVTIGAATPHAAAAADPIVTDRLPMLASALATIANPRVRWQGTLGGNLCFAEPRSDLFPVLVALTTALILRGPNGERTIGISDFVLDAFTVDRQDDELLVRLVIETDGIEYQRYHRIQIGERPTVGVALVRRMGGWRLCVGAVGYVPVLHTADGLEDLEPEAVAEAVEPIVDAAGSADYKRHLVRVLVARALRDAGAAA